MRFRCYPLIDTLFMILQLIDLADSVQIPGRYFHKLPSFTMMPLTTLTSIDSLSSCIFKCLGVPDLCYSFIYTASIQTCKLGSHLLTIETSNPSNGTEYFSSSTICTEQPGFTLWSSGNIAACVRLSPNVSNYEAAKLSCAALGAHLYTLRLKEKFSILRNIANTAQASIWIGLDDIAQEGVYVWADDGSVMTSGVMSYTFAPGQPNNYANQDCIFYDYPKNGLNDEGCGIQILYLCEIY